MQEYAISFEGRNNAININQLDGTSLFGLFSNYDGQLIDMYRLVATLNNNGFQVTKIINNSNDTIYRIWSNQMKTGLNLTISKDMQYLQKNRERYLPTTEVLKAMSKNAEVINNNVIDFNSFNENSVSKNDYKPNLQLIKGTKHNRSIKKLLKTKKGKIALCTIIGFAIVAGSFMAHTIAVRAEAQEVINNNSQYSYQNNPSSDTINQQRQLYQAIQNGEVDDSLANPNGYIEEMKMDYNEENYQNVR